MTPLYTAEATTTGNGRSGGRGRTSDGRVEVEFTEPTAVGGPEDRRTNPEQLAALAYSACFASALQVVARRRDVTLTDPTVTAKVNLGREGEGYIFEFEIVATLPGVDREQADALVAEAHQVCPYSRAFQNGAKATARAA